MLAWRADSVHTAPGSLWVGRNIPLRVWDPLLTVGVARTVIAPVEGPGAVPARFADALTRWESRDTVGAAAGRKHEQILSLFGRWVLPGDGLEVYGEWAR